MEIFFRPVQTAEKNGRSAFPDTVSPDRMILFIGKSNKKRTNPLTGVRPLKRSEKPDQAFFSRMEANSFPARNLTILRAGMTTVS